MQGMSVSKGKQSKSILPWIILRGKWILVGLRLGWCSIPSCVPTMEFTGPTRSSSKSTWWGKAWPKEKKEAFRILWPFLTFPTRLLSAPWLPIITEFRSQLCSALLPPNCLRYMRLCSFLRSRLALRTRKLSTSLPKLLIINSRNLLYSGRPITGLGKIEICRSWIFAFKTLLVQATRS